MSWGLPKEEAKEEEKREERRKRWSEQPHIRWGPSSSYSNLLDISLSPPEEKLSHHTAHHRRRNPLASKKKGSSELGAAKEKERSTSAAGAGESGKDLKRRPAPEQDAPKSPPHACEAARPSEALPKPEAAARKD